MTDDAVAEHETRWHYAVNPEDIGTMVQEFTDLKQQRATDHGLLLSMSVAIQGVPNHDFEGNITGYEGGIAKDVAELKQLANGGDGLSVSRGSRFKTALLTTSMIATAQILVALIGVWT